MAEESKQSNHEEKSSVQLKVNDKDVAQSVEKGVMDDKLNYGKLGFWSGVGFVVFIVFMVSLVYIFQYKQFLDEQKAADSQFQQIKELRAQSQERLSSFGVVNQEEGIYHIPIDSAMHKVVSEYQQ